MKKTISTRNFSNGSILHHNITDILFNHKKEILNKFLDIKGLHFIDHIAIILINPKNEIIVFSSTPSVEYNLLIKELWRYDMTFNPSLFSDGDLFWWHDSYHREFMLDIRQMKEYLHKFTLGVNLVKKTENFNFVYSFATRNKDIDMSEYYLDVKDDLFRIGNYGYNLIRDIYSRYCTPLLVPVLNEQGIAIKKKSHLKLIISN